MTMSFAEIGLELVAFGRDGSLGLLLGFVDQIDDAFIRIDSYSGYSVFMLVVVTLSFAFLTYVTVKPFFGKIRCSVGMLPYRSLSFEVG